jgi:predicted MFS family arabinose efflux permease
MVPWRRTDPPRLGRGFGPLWAATAVSNVGDGVALAAGPLLVASLTDDPALIGGAAFAQQLPWLLFSLISGAYVDRLDRRRLVVSVNLLRATVLGVLAAAVATGAGTVPLIYLAFFVLGTAETLADNASVTLLATVVPKAGLPSANARLLGTQILANQLAGPPLGAWLFVVAAALPFGATATTFLLAAGLLTLLPRDAGRTAGTGERRRLRAEIAEGVRWLWHHRVLRMLAVSLCLMNITFFGTFSILVLYARDRLGLSEVGYGVLLACGSIGGLAGSVAAGRLERRFGAALLLRVGLVVETVTHLVFAVTTSPWVAGATFALFGMHAIVWSVVTLSLRQRVVPARLLGRVNSVYYLFSVGGAALGALSGGLLARSFGITAPFWFAFASMLVLTAVAWRLFTRGKLDAEQQEVELEPAP